jgi:uncharacterized protein YbjT (DUF2867 family)
MGRRLVPLLVADGYKVVAMTRDRTKAAQLQAIGAKAVVADALDREAVLRAVTGARLPVTAAAPARPSPRCDRRCRSPLRRAEHPSRR